MNLPCELLDEVFSHLAPRDCSALARTCRQARSAHRRLAAFPRWSSGQGRARSLDRAVLEAVGAALQGLSQLPSVGVVFVSCTGKGVTNVAMRAKLARGLRATLPGVAVVLCDTEVELAGDGCSSNGGEQAAKDMCVAAATLGYFAGQLHSTAFHFEGQIDPIAKMYGLAEEDGKENAANSGASSNGSRLPAGSHCIVLGSRSSSLASSLSVFEARNPGVGMAGVVPANGHDRGVCLWDGATLKRFTTGFVAVGLTPVAQNNKPKPTFHTTCISVLDEASPPFVVSGPVNFASEGLVQGIIAHVAEVGASSPVPVAPALAIARHVRLDNPLLRLALSTSLALPPRPRPSEEDQAGGSKPPGIARVQGTPQSTTHHVVLCGGAGGVVVDRPLQEGMFVQACLASQHLAASRVAHAVGSAVRELVQPGSAWTSFAFSTCGLGTACRGAEKGGEGGPAKGRRDAAATVSVLGARVVAARTDQGSKPQGKGVSCLKEDGCVVVVCGV